MSRAAPTAESAPFCQGSPELVAEAGRRIEADLGLILEAIRGKGRALYAVLLTGSLGRGEGTLLAGPGGPELLSDYDLWALTAEPCPTAFFRDLEAGLNPRLWGAHVTIGALPVGQLPGLAPALWTYDLRHGSRVVAGPAGALEALPDYRPGDIPAWEAVKLLCNYAAVLLAVLPGRGRPAPGDRELAGALLRLAYRLGDALAIQAGCYQVRLSGRPEALGAVAAFQALPPEGQELIRWACREKVHPREFLARDPRAVADRLLPLFERVLTGLLADYLAAPPAGLPALLEAYRARFGSGLSWKGRLLAHLARWRRGDPDGLPPRVLALDRYHYVLSLAPLLLQAAPALPAASEALAEACRLLALPPPRPDPEGPRAAWETCREKAVRLWTAIC